MLVIVQQFEGNGTDNVKVEFDIETTEFQVTATDKVTGNPVVPGDYTTIVPDLSFQELVRLCGEGDNTGNQFIIYGSNTTPYAYINQIIEDAPDCAAPGPTCDITLSLSKTDETSLDADNGSITASAVSSYSNIQYSLDSGPFQSSGVFGGLAPKTYSVRARDANGCIATKFITIEAYLSPLVATPTVELPSGNSSRWNAAFNPTIFKFRRNNYSGLVSASDETGIVNVALQVILSDDEVQSALTDPVMVKGENYSYFTPALGHFAQSGVSVLQFNGSTVSGNQSVKVFTVATKPNYKIELRITSGSTVLTGFWSADKNGDVRADISVYLKALVSPTNRFVAYTAMFREVWDGNTGQFYSAGQTFYATYSAMQLGDNYGGNMAEYVAFPANSEAKWLSKTEVPKYWSGLPFDVCFLFNGGADISIRATRMDINKNAISAPTILPVSDAPGVKSQDLDLIPGSVVKFLKLEVINVSNSEEITEAKFIEVFNECTDPFIYLKWLNTLGGWEYYRFGFSQSNLIDTSNLHEVSRNVMDWQNDSGMWDVIKKRANRRMQFGADDIRDASQFESLATSIKVMAYIRPGLWHTVELNTGSFTFGTTRDRNITVQFSITMPDINIQNQ